MLLSELRRFWKQISNGNISQWIDANDTALNIVVTADRHELSHAFIGEILLAATLTRHTIVENSYKTVKWMAPGTRGCM